jgi:hypothetical protein
MDSSTSSSQLKSEIKMLTKSVAQLETEISQAPEPLRRQTTRIINLDRFRKAQESFLELHKSIHDFANSKSQVSGSPSLASYKGIHEELEDPRGDKNDISHNPENSEHSIFRTVDDWESLLVISQDSILTTSKDSISVSERANMRILAVLKSYRYNMEQGMLVTGQKVAPEVATELRDLIDTANGQVYEHLLRQMNGVGELDSTELWDMSDEEGVVREIRKYLKGLSENGGVVSDSVLEIAQAIVS